MVDDIRQQLRAVQESYRASLPDKLARLEVLWHLLQAENELQASYEEFYRLLHTMAGSAETLGYPALTQAARAMVQQLKTSKQPAHHVRNLVAEYEHVIATIRATIAS